MTTEPEYRRATCFVCGAICEQRRRSVLCDGAKRPAYECLECEAIYVVADGDAPTVELPGAGDEP